MKFLKNLFNSIKSILVSLILVFVIVFMINNREIITINFNPLPFDSIETRLFVLMLFFYILGLITAILIYSNSLIKSAIRNLKQKRQINKLQQQINEK
ncbi:MAG: lipopolysaccharide assembly protein LapA domain-containing protein [Alphaproteobacteria bacterium]